MKLFLKPQELVPLLLKAAIKFKNPEYERAAQKIAIPERDVSVLLLQAELRAARPKVASAASEGGAKK